MYTDKEIERMGTFISTTLAYTPEHLSALYGKSKMTKELFHDCLRICVRTGNPKEFFEICEQFPEFSR